ncbi:hypothetical protein [Methanobacterium alcaliphilum]|nr:hypothetical protein [Methanobacterium alcaliphilum]
MGDTLKPKDDAAKCYKEIRDNVITTQWNDNSPDYHEDGKIDYMS